MSRTATPRSARVEAATGPDRELSDELITERFRPHDYDGKPRHMPKAERKELDALVKACRDHIAGLTDWRCGTLLKAFMSVSPINCSWQHHGLAELFVWETAAALRARSAEEK